jgi:hypothetical protein
MRITRVEAAPYAELAARTYEQPLEGAHGAQPGNGALTIFLNEREPTLERLQPRTASLARAYKR